MSTAFQILAAATDTSKISSNRNRSSFGISIYPLFIRDQHIPPFIFAKTPFNNISFIKQIWIVLTWFPSKSSKLFALTLDSLPKYQTWLSSGGSVFLSNKVDWGWILRIWAASKIWDAAQTSFVSLNLYSVF